MHRMFVLLLALLALSPLHAHDWLKATTLVEHSLVRVTYPIGDDGSMHTCSGFVISEKAALVITTYHCVAEDNGQGPLIASLLVDDKPAQVVDAWPDQDIAIVSAVIKKPALKYRTTPPHKGLDIAALGYGYGLHTSMVLIGHVATPTADWSSNGIWLTSSFPFIKGMSGGPVFDRVGRVVGIVQQTDSATGLSRPLPTIIRLTKRYWD